MPVVRYWLPGIVVLGGIAAIAFGPSDIRWEGGLGIVGAGVAIFMINVLYRLGASGDREREQEDRAREYFDRHGRWPDD
jgi:hypothetical protein